MTGHCIARVMRRAGAPPVRAEPSVERQNENLTEPCIVRGARVLVTRPKFAFV